MTTALATDPMALLGSPVHPPDEFFTLPDDFDPVHDPDEALIRVYTSGAQVGRVAALVAPLSSCILDGREARGRCITPPPDNSGFQFAHIGNTVTASGITLKTSIIPGGLSHAPHDATWRQAVDHYAHTGTSKMRVQYLVDPDRGGIFAVGALNADVTVWDAIVLQASALSGDWRWIDELDDWRMIASQVVNVPGFRPAERRRPTTASCSVSILASAGRVQLLWVDEDNDVADIAARVRAILAAPRHFSEESRKDYAKSGVAMKDGSFPIPDRGALRRAIQAFGRATNKSAVKAHIIRRANALNASELLPDGWA